jgi:glutaredoxin
MARYELYGTASCPHTQEVRESLEWRGETFVEYDVEQDRVAFDQLVRLTHGERIVPVLVEGGRVVQVGWHGRGCVVGGSWPNSTSTSTATTR